MKREEIIEVLKKYSEIGRTKHHIIYSDSFESIADELQAKEVTDEDISEPIQNALYATNNFTTDQCSNITDGILEYIKDAGFKIIRQ